MNYQFTITFSLPEQGKDPEKYLDALYEAGCSDALVGIGQVGLVSLQFDREATDAVEAMRTAIEDVRKAIPDAQISEVSPDLVGMAEIANVLGVTRQMVRKYTLTKEEFPRPVHTSEAVALWHLVEIVTWAEINKSAVIKKKGFLLDTLKEVSAVAFKLNLELQQLRQQRLVLDIIGSNNARKLVNTVVKNKVKTAKGPLKKKAAIRRTERAID